MKIAKICIKKLFGLFDHEIQFNNDERITIIHGPNGVGKTTILKLINNLFSMQFSYLRDTPYKSITIIFDNKSSLTVKRETAGKKIKETQIGFNFKKYSNARGRIYSLYSSRNLRNHHRHFPLRAISDIIMNLKRVGASRWLDTNTDETISFEEVMLKYGHMLPFSFRRSQKPFPIWLKNILSSLHVHFIQTQRLFSVHIKEEYEESEAVHAVTRYSEEMANQIQRTLRESGSLAASLDRTFPHRLMTSSTPKKATAKYIMDEYVKQTEYRIRLMRAGLIDAEDEVPIPKSKLSPNERKVLWYYLRDVEKKLKVFDQLLSKVELFKEIINTRFLYKTFEVDKKDGFVFNTSRQEKVPLEALSSGEQHELVLAYELLFKVESESLILIDEPELSLHVTWQHKFLDDIERISRLADLDFLIATHSPSIIHDRSDLMVSLGETE